MLPGFSWAPLLLPSRCNTLLGRGHILNYSNHLLQNHAQQISRLLLHPPAARVALLFLQGPVRHPPRGEKEKRLPGTLSLGFTWGSYFSTVAKWDELSYPPTA